MPCPFEWPAQMFCLGKKICSRFWWLKMSLHWSTSKICMFSVRSMRLCPWRARGKDKQKGNLRLIACTVLRINPLGFIKLNESKHKKNPLHHTLRAYRPLTYSSEVTKHFRLAKLCADSWYFGRHELAIWVFISISLLSINKAWKDRNDNKTKKWTRRIFFVPKKK